MWKKLRIAVLLLILLFVALTTYFDRIYTTDWDMPLRVAIFPINADGSDTATRYIQTLQQAKLQPLEDFFSEEAQRYGLKLDRPVRFSLAEPMRELPPLLDQRAGRLSIALWSLRMRYWAWRVPRDPPRSHPNVRLFVLYHDPALSPSLPHSVGLQKGLFGIVNAFATQRMAGANDTVTAHELLHTLGATDKYAAGTNLPRLPDGFAEPNLSPLYPQSLAELMAGRIPLSPSRAEIPESLQQVIIGPASAAEIGWRKR